MRYQKSIKYLEYLENGTKLRTAGFVKMELRDLDGGSVRDKVPQILQDEVPHTVCCLYLQVRGFPMLENLSREVYLEAGAKTSLLGELQFRQGKAELSLSGQDASRLGQEALSYEELTAIRVPIGKGKELLCRWREVSEEKEDLLHAAEAASEAEAPLPEPEPVPPSSEFQRPAEPMPEPAQVLLSCELQRPAKAALAPRSPAEPMPEAAPAPPSSELQRLEKVLPEARPLRNPPGLPPHFYEDKWQQLSSIYPHISPFGDDRDYLSIGPEDFVVLQKQYHGLVANSFLLHGYYNYEHLILARIMSLGQVRYYLGVPGNFYEKERQVAILFGFESFECKREPVQDGDFGYYCIRVDI